jgi:Gpi18-like mannosyltransferase
MWGVRQVFNQQLPPHSIFRPYLGVQIETNQWLEPWQRWDAIHYQAIAEKGYAAFDEALFTPPLFPLLTSLLHRLTGWSTLISGILIANMAFLASLAALYQLVEYETNDRQIARGTLIYLASFPTAFFFLAGYTESLFLLAAILSIYSSRKEKWLLSGFWGAVAALTRVTGGLLILPLTFNAWQVTRKKFSWHPWASAFLTACGILIFPLYIGLYLHQSPLTPLAALTERFQGGLAFPGYNLFLALRDIVTGHSMLADWFDVTFLLLFLSTIPFIVRYLPSIYTVYQVSFLILYLMSLSHIQPLLSTARYVLALFPAFIVFRLWGRNPWIQRIYLYLSWTGILFLSGQFAIWGWVG